MSAIHESPPRTYPATVGKNLNGSRETCSAPQKQNGQNQDKLQHRNPNKRCPFRATRAARWRRHWRFRVAIGKTIRSNGHQKLYSGFPKTPERCSIVTERHPSPKYRSKATIHQNRSSPFGSSWYSNRQAPLTPTIVSIHNPTN